MQEQAGWELGGHRRSTWWRRAAVLGAVVAAAVAVLLATGPAVTPPPIVVGSEAPSGGMGDPVGWSPLDRSTGSVLYLADPAGTVRVLDVDRAEIVDDLPLRPALGDQPLLLARVGRAAVLQTDDGRVHAFGGGLPDVVDLGRSLLFLPAPPDGVWLVTGDSWGPGGSVRVRQVDLAGARIVPPTPVPPGQTPVAAQGDRVLLEGDDMLGWWTPWTGEVRRIPGRRGLATGQTTTVVCDAPCRTVGVLHRDGTRAARLRMAEPVAAAAVAPDERAIALLTASELASAAVVIVDRDAEAMRTVTNGVDGSLAARGLTWSPDGRWLFFPTTTGRVGVVDRASGRVSVVDADVGAFDALAAGPSPRRCVTSPAGRWANAVRGTPVLPDPPGAAGDASVPRPDRTGRRPARHGAHDTVSGADAGPGPQPGWWRRPQVGTSERCGWSRR